MHRTLTALTCLAGLAFACAAALADGQPTVTVSAKAELLQDVLARVREQTGVVVAADAFATRRRVTVEINAKPLTEALGALATAAVSAWDPAYILVPASSGFSSETTPVGWERPPQTALTLSGGSGTVDEITRKLSNLCAAAVGFMPDKADRRVATQPAQGASLEDVLSALDAPGLKWTRGYWLASIDRAAVFERFASLPPEQREALVLRHAQQMLKFNSADVRQALMARNREFTALSAAQREQQIQRYAEEIRAGIGVLNALSPSVRAAARDAMRVFFDQGLLVYRDLTQEEQIETTPIIEAMGELRR